MGRGGEGERRGSLDRAARQLRRGVARARAPRLAARHRHRPDERARSPRGLRAGRTHVGRGGGPAARRPRRLHPAGQREHGGARRRDGGLPGSRRGHVRLREQPAGGGRAGRPRPRSRLRLPGLRTRLRAPALLRGQGALPVGGALGRPGRHPRDRPCGGRALPRERAAPAMAAPGRGACGVPGAARADLLARLRGARPRRRAVQRDGCARRRGRADRDRARPPRRRERREPVSRDRGDARRVRRDRRLADPERADQHGGGRALGERAPWRRRRDRVLDPRRDGGGRRRHRERGGPPATRAHDRPRHGRRATRRRRVRARRGVARDRGVRVPMQEGEVSE